MATPRRLALAVFVIALAAIGAWWWSAVKHGPDTDALRRAAAPLPGAAAPPSADLTSPDTTTPPAAPSRIGERVAAPVEFPSAALTGSTSHSDAEATATLTVRVVRGQGGRPLADTVVRIRAGAFGAQRVRARAQDKATDDVGEATFEGLAPGSYGVEAPRGTPRVVRLAAGATESVTLVIEPGIEVHGEVIDSDGAAVPRADVLLSERWSADRVVPVATADAAGRFVLADVQRDTLVSARAPGFLASLQVVPRGEPGDQMNVVLRLSNRGAHIRGVVLDAHGEPAVDAVVLLGEDPLGWHEVEGTERAAPAPLRLQVDDAGRFESREAPSGEVLLRAFAEGHAPYDERVVIGAADARELVVRLEPAATVFGVVRDSHGAAVRRALVTTGFQATDLRVFSDEDGAYTLDGLAPGTVSLDAREDTAGRAVGALELSAGELFEWNPTLAPTPFIHGRVLDEQGNGVGGLQVSVTESSRSMTHGSLTRADGSFRIPHLEDVAYRVTVRRSGEWRDFPLAARDDVRPSAEPLVLRLDAGDVGRIVATVLGPEGGVVPGARITIWHHTKRLWSEVTADGETGRVEAVGVPGGELDLGLDAPGFGARVLGRRTLEAGADLDLGELRFAAVGSVELTLRGVDAERAATCHVELVALGADARAKRVKVDGLVARESALAEGRWRARVSGRRVTHQEIEFDVVAGRTTRLDLQLATCGERRLRIIVEREGAPAPMCWMIDAQHRSVWHSGQITREGDAYITYPCAPPGRYTLITWLGPEWRIEEELSFTGAADDGESLIRAR